MKRVLPIVLAAAVAGGLVGGLIGLALDGNDTGPGVSRLAEAAPLTNASSSAAPAGASLTPEAIYKSDATGVVLITDKSGRWGRVSSSTSGATSQRTTTSSKEPRPFVSGSATARRIRRRSSAPTRPRTSPSSV